MRHVRRRRDPMWRGSCGFQSYSGENFGRIRSYFFPSLPQTPLRSHLETSSSLATPKRTLDNTSQPLTNRAVRVKRNKSEDGEGGGQSSDILMLTALLEDQKQQRIEDREMRRAEMELSRQQHRAELEASEQRFMLIFAKLLEKTSQ